MPSIPDQEAETRPLERLRARYGDRAIAIAVTLAIELALLAMLLSLGIADPAEEPGGPAVATFDVSTRPEEPQPEEAEETPDTAAEDTVPAPADRPDTQPVPRPVPSVPVPAPRPVPEIVIPRPDAPRAEPSPPPAPAPDPDRPRAVIREDQSYGPPDTGSRSAENDTPIVGTAPNGEPLYAAQWFREPTRQEMAGYLSAVAPPAWALIACRTAPNWRVEDCVGLEQSPSSSRLQQAVLAATWQFQVRPPRKGGRYMVGEWVRIRIDYGRGGVRTSG